MIWLLAALASAAEHKPSTYHHAHSPAHTHSQSEIFSCSTSHGGWSARFTWNKEGKAEISMTHEPIHAPLGSRKELLRNFVCGCTLKFLDSRPGGVYPEFNGVFTRGDCVPVLPPDIEKMMLKKIVFSLQDFESKNNSEATLQWLRYSQSTECEDLFIQAQELKKKAIEWEKEFEIQ